MSRGAMSQTDVAIAEHGTSTGNQCEGSSMPRARWQTKASPMVPSDVATNALIWAWIMAGVTAGFSTAPAGQRATQRPHGSHAVMS